MVAKDINLKPVQENSVWQDFDDADETLSFSDLPLNNNSSVNWDDDFSKEDQNQDFFEFFSEDFSDSITYPTNNNIIFCGKLIPYKEATVADHDQKVQNQEIKFISKSHSFDLSSSRNMTSSKLLMKQEKLYKNCRSFPVDNHYNKYDFSRKRASISVKSRWFLFGRFPIEMELRDIKKRQSKNQPKMKMFRSDDRTDVMAPKSADNKRKKVKSLWGLLRVFARKKSPIK